MRRPFWGPWGSGHREILKNIFLYDGSRSTRLDVPELAQYLRERLKKVCIEVRRDIVLRIPEGPDALAREFAGAKILDPRRKRETRVPLPGEIRFEKNRLSNTTATIFGNIYDGLVIQEALRGLIPREEAGLHAVHIVITNQLLATWDDGDLRYHIRAAIYGVPALLSTSGLVEGPARPREFYMSKHGMGPGRWDSAAVSDVSERLRDRMLDHDDPRLTEVLKGYVMQAVAYHLTGDPFCDDADCRLFNAHWQEELIRVQRAGPREFCPRHEEVLRRFGESAPNKD